MRDKSAKRRIKREKQKEELTKEGMVSEDIDRSEIKQYVMKYFKKEWKMIIISQIILFAQTYINIQQPFFTQDFIEAAINGQTDNLISLAKVYAIQNTILLLSDPLLECVLSSFKKRMQMGIQADIYKEILSKDISYFEQTKFAQIQQLAHQGSKAVMELACGDRIFNTLKTIFKATGHCYFLFYQSVRITAILLVFCIVRGLWNHCAFSWKLELTKQTYQETIEKEKTFQDVIQNVITVKAFAREQKEIINFNSQLDKLQTSETKITALNKQVALFGELLSKVQKIIVLYYGSVYFITKAETVKVSTLTTLLSYSLAFTQLYTAIKDLFGYDQQNMYFMVGAIVSMTKIKATQGLCRQIDIAAKKKQENEMQQDQQASSDESTALLMRQLESIRGDIEFADVSFKYSDATDDYILKDISLSIKSGEFVAFAGTSGSGKSTVINLMERFYDCSEGAVLVDGVNIKDMDLGVLRTSIGLVQQEPVLFDSTILHNITYGVDSYDDETVVEICDISGVSEFVFDKERFPDGLQTLVGSKGLLLSGGQKQRVAIARALIKSPKILIFDEATSSLDAESEFQVQQYIDRLVKNRKMTIVVVAHRLSTIVNCDRIYLMQKGEIVEVGSHVQLLAKQGYYKQLINRQLCANNEDKNNADSRINSTGEDHVREQIISSNNNIDSNSNGSGSSSQDGEITQHGTCRDASENLTLLSSQVHEEKIEEEAGSKEQSEQQKNDRNSQNQQEQSIRQVQLDGSKSIMLQGNGLSEEQMDIVFKAVSKTLESFQKA